MRVLAGGGPPTPVTTFDASAGEVRQSWPQFLPDGRHVIYFAENSNPDKSAIYVQELGSRQRSLVMRNHLHAAWSPPGYLLFAREGTLFAQRMDAKTFQLSGEPVAIVQEVTSNDSNGRSAFAVSGNGVLVYRGGTTAQRYRQLAWYSREGKRLGEIGQPGDYFSVRLSPDEKSAALVVGPPPLDTWIMNLETGVLARLTNVGKGVSGSAWIGPWSPDSQRLGVNLANSAGILEVTAASGNTRELTKGIYTDDWLPDGSMLCRNYSGQEVMILGRDPGGARTINSTPYTRGEFRLAPNGKFVAYNSLESGSRQVFVASFPSFDEKRQVSLAGGINPAWRKDGKELFFVAVDGTLMSADIDTSRKIEAGTPHPLFRIPARNEQVFTYSPAGDGKRFLVIDRDQAQPAQMMVVVNWTADLK